MSMLFTGWYQNVLTPYCTYKGCFIDICDWIVNKMISLQIDPIQMKIPLNVPLHGAWLAQWKKEVRNGNISYVYYLIKEP